MKIDSTTSTSPTRSLALHVPGIGTAHAQLASVTYPNVAHARVAFSMKCGAASRIMSLMRLQVGVANRAATFDLYMRPDRFVVDENVIGTPSLGYFDYTIASGI